MTTLGAAYHRAGHDRETVETLEKADRLDPDSPAALAFRAMAHHRLGRQEEARAVLARLLEILDRTRGTKDEDSLNIVREAEALISIDPALPADPFAR